MTLKPEQCNVGGQAVIEGVMMRSPRSFAIACRRPSGEIALREQRWHALGERYRFLRWPIIRGAVVLLESLINGMSALTFSASQQELVEQQPPQETAPTAGQQTVQDTSARGEPSAAEKAKFTGVLILSIGMALLIFKALPHLLTWLLGLDTSSIAFHLVDGGFKVLLLVGYIAAIGQMKDIRRVFMYHGAEHKAIWAYEKGLELTVDNVRDQSRFHPRCGTSFLVMVILVSIFLFALVLRFPLSSISIVDNIVKILIKVPLMLPVAGISYEGIKLSGKFRQHPLVRVLVAPGLWLQRLTTKEPTDDQIEVGLLSLQKALWREQIGDAVEDSGVQVFASYSDGIAQLGLSPQAAHPTPPTISAQEAPPAPGGHTRQTDEGPDNEPSQLSSALKS